MSHGSDRQKSLSINVLEPFSPIDPAADFASFRRLAPDKPPKVPIAECSPDDSWANA